MIGSVFVENEAPRSKLQSILAKANEAYGCALVRLGIGRAQIGLGRV